MGTREIAAALQRAEAIFQRRPQAALHEDSTATARWQGGTRVVSSHASGAQVETDMPAELGGTGDRVAPGWLFRAAIASCATTSIALAAAVRGVELEALEVKASSRSDARGLLGMAESSGERVYAGPRDMQLEVRIRARGAASQELRALVEAALRCSPMPSAVQNANRLDLRIEVEGA